MNKKDANPFSPIERDYIAKQAAKGKNADQIRDGLREKFSIKHKVRQVEKELERIGMLEGRRSLLGETGMALGGSAPDIRKDFSVSSVDMTLDKTFSPPEIDFIKKLLDKGKSAEDIRDALIEKFSLKRKLDVVKAAIQKIETGAADEDKPVVIPDTQTAKPPAAEKAGLLFVHNAAALNGQKEAGPEEPEAERPEPKKIKLSFRIRHAEEFEEGKTYISGGIGAMHCTRVKKFKSNGTEGVMVKLEQIYGQESPVKKSTPLTNSLKKATREPVTPQEMEEIIYKLEHGLSGIKNVPDKSHRRADLYDKKIGSADPDDVADVLCLIYGRSKTKGELSITDSEYGQRGVKIIASEYAVVMGVGYDAALRLVSSKVGAPKPAFATLSAERAQLRFP